jgi:predicted RNA polymerase sigma factor
LLIRRGLAALERAERLGGAQGPYALQAAIAACHARATSAGETDWQRITALYFALSQLVPSPVVELNRAVAIAQTGRDQRALDLADRVADALDGYPYLHSTRAELLRRLERYDEARAAYARALELTRDDRERRFLEARTAELGAP